MPSHGRSSAVIVTLAGSGLRIGELLGLQVRDGDILRQTFRVERQRTQDGQLRQPRSASSVRTVPVGHVVIDELASHLAKYPSMAELFVDEIGRPRTRFAAVVGSELLLAMGGYGSGGRCAVVATGQGRTRLARLGLAGDTPQPAALCVPSDQVGSTKLPWLRLHKSATACQLISGERSGFGSSKDL